MTPREIINNELIKFHLDSIVVCEYIIMDGLLINKLDSTVQLTKEHIWPYDLREMGIGHPNCDILFIATNAYRQKKQTKREQLIALKGKLKKQTIWTSNYLSTDAWKVILIDGVSYFPKEIYDFIMDLDAKDVKRISETNLPLNPTIYGSLSPNGMIDIRLEKGVNVQ